MTHLSVTYKYQRVVANAAGVLLSCGFQQYGGSLFRLRRHENVAVVDFQKSTKTSKEETIFTINVGIVCGRILRKLDPRRRINDVRITDCHLRERIGFLVPEKADKWWTITASTDEKRVISEVTTALQEHTVPYVERFLNTENLRQLWISGKCPGLTEYQRTELLSILESR